MYLLTYHLYLYIVLNNQGISIMINLNTFSNSS